MLTEVLKEIRRAEEEADDLRRRAQLESRKIIQDAEREAAAMLSQKVSEAEAEALAAAAAGEEETRRLIVPLQQRADEDVCRIQSLAQAEQEAAITMVTERIVKVNGRS